MNGLGLAGFTGGLMQGLEFARRVRADDLTEAKLSGAERREQETMDLKRTELAQQEKYRSGLLDIYRDRETNDQRQQADKLGLERDQFRADTAYKNAVVANQAEDNRRQAGLAEAQIGNLQADNVLQSRRFDLEARIKARELEDASHQRNKEMARVRLDKIMAGGATPESAAEDYGIIKDALSVEPEAFLDGRVRNALNVFGGVIKGEVPQNDPTALAALSTVLGDRIQRGIKDVVPVPGVGEREVTRKAFAGVASPKEKPGWHAFMVRSFYRNPDGSEGNYDAPLTVHGTHDPNDPVLFVNQDAIENHFVALLKFQDVLDKNPDMRKRFGEYLAAGQKGKGNDGGSGWSDKDAQKEIRSAVASIAKTQATDALTTGAADRAAAMQTDVPVRALEIWRQAKAGGAEISPLEAAQRAVTEYGKGGASKEQKPTFEQGAIYTDPKSGVRRRFFGGDAYDPQSWAVVK